MIYEICKCILICFNNNICIITNIKNNLLIWLVLGELLR